jgi:hypothetical protein
MIKSEFLQLGSKSDWIQMWILHTYQYFDNNFILKSQIAMKLVALEI